MWAFKQICGVIGMSADRQQTEHELYLEKVRAEINHLLAQITRSSVETDKMRAETEKVYKELKWYEIVITVSLTLAIVAIVKLFL